MPTLSKSLLFGDVTAGQKEPALTVYEICFFDIFQKGQHEDLTLLSDEARLVYQLWTLNGELSACGFDSFFSFSMADYCTEYLQLLKGLGAKSHHNLLQQAMACFPNSIVPSDSAQRQDTWYALTEKSSVKERIERLDQDYQTVEDSLERRLHIFVLEHLTASFLA